MTIPSSFLIRLPVLVFYSKIMIRWKRNRSYKVSMEVDEDQRNGNVPTGIERFHSVNVTCKTYQGTLVIKFDVPVRYTNLQFLNAGAQGTVVSADDIVSKKRVAIKKMQHVCAHPLMARRAYREFVLLTTMRHPNIIRLYNAFSPQNGLDDFQDIYVVMELMNHNLHEVSQRMRLDHKTLSFFVYQTLCAIKHLHTSGVIHRDLKPSNIVVDDRCILKVLDFGLARKRFVDPSMRMSDYVVTRYYRAPEVILSIPYDEKVDIWSVGCILAELINHKVLFEGRDRIDQWTRIIQILGTPDEEFFQRLGKSAAQYVRTLAVCKPMPIREYVRDENFLPESENERANLTADQCRDLITHMLQIDPLRRYSVEQALNHPYVKLWWEDKEVNAPPSLNRYNDTVEYDERGLAEWKKLLFEEVKLFERKQNVYNWFPEDVL